jgi:hypothetical protein
VYAGLRRLDRVELVVHRRGGAGEVEDPLRLDVERKGHVVAHHLEAWLRKQVLDVALRAGEEVVDAEHLVTARDQTVAEV